MNGVAWVWVGVAAGGWTAASVLVAVALRLQRRIELVARAEHELRGPATAIGLAVAALRREPGGLRRALTVESELERLRCGLADLTAARSGEVAEVCPRTLALDGVLRGAAAAWRPAAQSQGRRLRVRWDGDPAPVRADPGRLAQAFGNLLANAVEHGSGAVELRGRTERGRARVEVRDAGPARPPPGGEPPHDTRRQGDRGRGYGLAIAARAAREAGGDLALERDAQGTIAVVELPLGDEHGARE